MLVFICDNLAKCTIFYLLHAYKPITMFRSNIFKENKKYVQAHGSKMWNWILNTSWTDVYYFETDWQAKWSNSVSGKRNSLLQRNWPNMCRSHSALDFFFTSLKKDSDFFFRSSPDFLDPVTSPNLIFCICWFSGGNDDGNGAHIQVTNKPLGTFFPFVVSQHFVSTTVVCANSERNS